MFLLQFHQPLLIKGPLILCPGGILPLLKPEIGGVEECQTKKEE
jgi:hypothetical protein